MEPFVERTADGVYFVTLGQRSKVLLPHATPDDLTAAIVQLQQEAAADTPAVVEAQAAPPPASGLARLKSLASRWAGLLGG
jgi:hypothetical protein